MMLSPGFWGLLITLEAVPSYRQLLETVM